MKAQTPNMAVNLPPGQEGCPRVVALDRVFLRKKPTKNDAVLNFLLRKMVLFEQPGCPGKGQRREQLFDRLGFQIGRTVFERGPFLCRELCEISEIRVSIRTLFAFFAGLANDKPALERGTSGDFYSVVGHF
jgi:hypothetical protein